MNIERLITMFMRMFTRIVMKRGIDAGINYATRGRGKKVENTPEDQERAKDAKEIAKKARQGAKIARRLGRM